MAIGTGWVDGAWVDAGWQTNAWSQEVGGGASTSWTDRKWGERMGTRTIVYPAYHGRGRKY